MPELKLGKSSRVQEEKVQVLLSEKELRKLMIVIWKSLVQHSPVKGTVFKRFCYAELLAYYTLENKSNKTCQYQPDLLDNKLLSPEKFAHHMLLLFYAFRYEKELLSSFPPVYQNKLQEKGVQNPGCKNKQV